MVLDHVRRLAAAGIPGVEEREYCVGISFGSGVGIETVLMRKLSWGGNDPYSSFAPGSWGRPAFVSCPDGSPISRLPAFVEES